MTYRLQLSLSVALVLLGAGLGAREITYPAGHGIVVDVTAAPYGADRTGEADAAGAIEAAVAAARGQGTPRIVYFPDGVYRIGRPVVLETRTPGGQYIMLQGQSRDGVVLRCDPGAPDFQNPASPRALISFFEGDWTNNAFQMLFENFTVEVAAGNPGAIGVRFHGNNVARMENVRIVSLDPAGTGAIGLDLKPAVSSPGIIKRVEVEGFNIGLDLSNSGTTAYGWTIESVAVRNQLVAGIQTHRKGVSILDFTSVNTVPAISSLFRDGMLTVLGADLRTPEGATTDGAALVSKGDFLYLRDVSMSGYANLLDDNGTLLTALAEGESYFNGPTYRLWQDSLDDFLHLPIEATPEVPWDAPEDWVLVDPNAQGDDTEALQAALLSGARTVFLLPGFFSVSRTLRVGPEVQRIASNWSRIQWTGELFASGQPIFSWEQSNHEVVIMERLAANWLQNSREYMVHHATQADLVLRDCFWVGGGVYRNAPTGGRLFIENTCNVPGGQQFRPDLPSYVIVNQQAWARQFNPEMALPMLVVDGGDFWVSGFKFGEQQGPVVVARNQARVEMLGGFMNVTHGVELEPPDTPIFEIDNARVSARLIERAGEIFGPPNWNFRHRYVAREVRDGELRVLSTTDPVVVHRDTVSRNGPGMGGAMVPLYTSLLDPALYAGNTAPSIQAAAAPAATVRGGAQLLAVAHDDDGPAAEPAVHWRTIDGPGAAWFADAGSPATRVTVSVPGRYTFVATASDGLLRADSAPVQVDFVPEPQTLRLAGPALQRLADLPPRDGKADTILASIFLFAGDFSSSPTAQEQEIRLHMETLLRQWTGQSGAIASATLHLVPKSLVNPAPLDLVRTTTHDYGIVTLEDFAAQSTFITRIQPADLHVGVPLVLDVTGAVRAALSEGRDAIALQLRLPDGPDDNGQSNYAEFYGAHPATPQYDPRLVVELIDPPTFTFVEGVALLADGTGYAPGLGWIEDSGGGWWYSHALRRHVSPDPASPAQSLHLYLAGQGWTWTRADLFPRLYSFARGAWLHALVDGHAYWFYDYTAGQWLRNGPDGRLAFP